MAITIQGIKLTSLSVTLNKEDGAYTFTGNYELISNTGVTLAKQSFNGYNDVKLNGSIETNKALNDLVGVVKKDLNTTLGIE